MMCAGWVGTLAVVLAVTSSLSHPRAAHAWGDDGHRDCNDSAAVEPVLPAASVQTESEFVTQ